MMSNPLKGIVINRSKILLFILLSLSFSQVIFGEPTLDTNDKSQIIFSNFSKDVILTLYDNENAFYKTQRGVRVQLTNRLLLKTTSNISMDRLLSRYPQLSYASLYYESKKFIYFKVEISPKSNISSLLNILGKDHDILLAQPDILQLNRNKNTIQGQDIAKSTKDYFKSIGIVKLWKNLAPGLSSFMMMVLI